ncbi:MAG: hypothetical protein AB8B58_07115 [Roseobacter sp.]
MSTHWLLRGSAAVQHVGGGVVPRWLWFLPLMMATVLGGLWAFRMGWVAATITETDVINTFAQRYLETEGPHAQRTDCVARPGQAPGVWIVVSCQSARGTHYDYAVNRFGTLLQRAVTGDAVTRPET